MTSNYLVFFESLGLIEPDFGGQMARVLKQSKFGFDKRIQKYNLIALDDIKCKNCLYWLRLSNARMLK